MYKHKKVNNSILENLNKTSISIPKNIHLISYADHKFEKAKDRLYKEANQTGWFNTIKIYSPKDLSYNFKNKYKSILKLKRGGGYWIWKPYIILERLKEINDNDFLLYIDAGCTININGKKRFSEYINLLNNTNKNMLRFQMTENIEKEWTIQEIFDLFNINLDNQIANSGQLMATIIIMKKDKNLVNQMTLLNKIIEMNPLLITDCYNKGNKNKYLKENRHDQSFFSVFFKLYNPVIIKDETYFKNFKDKKCQKYPFWATRKK